MIRLHIFRTDNILQKSINLLSQNSCKSLPGFILCSYTYLCYLEYENITKPYENILQDRICHFFLLEQTELLMLVRGRNTIHFMLRDHPHCSLCMNSRRISKFRLRHPYTQGETQARSGCNQGDAGGGSMGAATRWGWDAARCIQCCNWLQGEGAA